MTSDAYKPRTKFKLKKFDDWSDIEARYDGYEHESPEIYDDGPLMMLLTLNGLYDDKIYAAKRLIFYPTLEDPDS